MNNCEQSRHLWRLGAVALLTALTTLTAGYSADLSVKAFLDKNVVGVGDQFTLSLQLSGSDAGDVADPGPPEIQSFGRYLGSGSSRNIQIVNGQMSSTRTINYYFQAISAGKHEIGSIVVNHGGTEYPTSPISIEMVERRPGSSRQNSQRRQEGISNNDLFVRASLSKPEVYQNEAVVLTYTIFTRVNVSSYSLTKIPDKTGFWVEDLLKDQQQPSTSEIIDGVQYTVATVQRMVLFPASPGTKTLEPLEIECEIQVRSTRRSLFDDFFSDPFGSTRRYSIRSDPVKIEVMPLPDINKPEGFAGAVGQFRLSGGVGRTEVDANDVVTFRIQLEGSGNIRTLPAPSVSFSEGIENYEPKVTENVRVSGNQVKGSRTYEYVLVPRVPGTQRIRSIQFPYFDPDEEKYKIASLGEVSLEISAGSQLAIQAPVASLSKEDVRLLAQEIRFIKLDPGRFRGIDYAVHKSSLFWGIALLPIFGVLCSLWYRRHLDRLQGDQAYARSRQASRLAKKRLGSARTVLPKLEHREFYAECGKALQGFAADKLNIPEAGIISEKLAHVLSARGVSDPIIAEYMDCIRTSDMRRFSPVDSGKQEMTEFLIRAEMAIQNLHKELAK